MLEIIQTVVEQVLEIVEEYNNPNLRHHRNGKPMELDIFLPTEQLAFEYQGEHHYSDHYTLGLYWQQQQTDQDKREACNQKHITLIEIPYWWDNELASLRATVHQRRPDLISKPSFGVPIPPKPGDDESSKHLIHSFWFIRD